MSTKSTNTFTTETAKAALMPKLRFPEFRGAKGWEEKRLGNEGEFLSSLTGKTGGDFDIGEAKFVTYMNVFSNTFVDPKALRHVDVKEDENQNAVATGDIFFTISSETPDEVGMSSVLLEHLENCYLNSFCALFRFSKGKHLNPVFTGYLLRQPMVRCYFAKKAQGSTRFNLSKDAFRLLPLFVPSPAEQQKIADCLGSLDELIAAQGRKVEALKTHKKGLMQQLFPREGESQPRLRFPEFQDAGEWSGAPMGALLVSSPDYGVNAAAVPFSESLPRYLRITDISEDGRYLPEKQVSVDLNVTDGNYLDKGDIVLARTGASVGKSYQYRQEDGKLVFAGFLIRIRPHPKKLVSTYLANFLTTGQFWKWVSVTSARSGQPGINGTEYSSLPIPLPPTLPEQQRIASCLSSLDAMINAVSRELDTLKIHKQGLMQQLFPSTEALDA